MEIRLLDDMHGFFVQRPYVLLDVPRMQMQLVVLFDVRGVFAKWPYVLLDVPRMKIRLFFDMHGFCL